MSRKIVNVLTAINIVFGIISILILSNILLTTLSITVDSELYMKSVHAMIVLFFFFYNSYILSILRTKTNHNKKFEFNKENKRELSIYTLVFLVTSIFVYLLSIFLKDYSIKRLDIYKDFPLAYHFTILFFIFFIIYFIYLHFSKQN